MSKTDQVVHLTRGPQPPRIINGKIDPDGDPACGASALGEAITVCWVREAGVILPERICSECRSAIEARP